MTMMMKMNKMEAREKEKGNEKKKNVEAVYEFVVFFFDVVIENKVYLFSSFFFELFFCFFKLFFLKNYLLLINYQGIFLFLNIKM